MSQAKVERYKQEKKNRKTQVKNRSVKKYLDASLSFLSVLPSLYGSDFPPTAIMKKTGR